MEEWERKAHSRARRRQRLSAADEGYDFRTRIIPAKSYERRKKYRPFLPEDWED